jgi:hypothetical protein
MSILLPKDPQHRDRAYLDWLREQPCLFTGHTGCDPMHIGTAGTSLKVHDYWAIPIRQDLHRHVGHQKGEVSMIRTNCPDWLLRDAMRLYAQQLYRQYKERL